MRIRFGDFLFDEPNFRLERSGERIELRPKVFDLLAHLVRHRQRVVRREELVEALWETTIVGPGSLSGLVNELRQALGEDGRGPSSIRTVHARGYQFVAPADEDVALAASSPPGASLGASSRSDALIAGVAAGGVAGVVVEQAAGHAERNGRSAVLQELVEAAGRAGFECHRISAPNRSQVAATSFSRRLVEVLSRARGRETVRSALPLPARAWFEDASLRDVAGGAVRGGSGPPDPIGTSVRVLAELARRRPLVLIIDDVDATDVGFAQMLCDLTRALDAAPLLWVIPIEPGASLADAHQLLARQAGFEKWRGRSAAIAGLDAALGRHGVAPLPVRLSEALAAHLGECEDALECMAEWLRQQTPTAPEYESVERRREGGRSAIPEESVPRRRLRRVEPVDRTDERSWIHS